MYPPACCRLLRTACGAFGDRRTGAAHGFGALSHGRSGRGPGVRQQPGKPVGRDQGAARGGGVARTGSQVRAVAVKRVPCGVQMFGATSPRSAELLLVYDRP